MRRPEPTQASARLNLRAMAEEMNEVPAEIGWGWRRLGFNQAWRRVEIVHTA